MPDDVWKVCSLIRVHVPCVSFQIRTRESYEHDASNDPKRGWDHATCQIGPSWLLDE